MIEGSEKRNCWLCRVLKWYYDQKITFIFSSDFATMFTKNSPSEILSLNFDNFSVLMVHHNYTRKDTMTSFTQEL